MISHVSLKSSDVLVVTVDDVLTTEATARLKENIERVLPTGTAVWIIDKSLKVEVLSVDARPLQPKLPESLRCFDHKSVV